MTAKQFRMVGRKLTNDHDCYESTEYYKQLKGYTTGTHTIHSNIQRLPVMIPCTKSNPYLGREAFNRAFFEHSLTPATPIIVTFCTGGMMAIVTMYGMKTFHYIPVMKMQWPVDSNYDGLFYGNYSPEGNRVKDQYSKPRPNVATF